MTRYFYTDPLAAAWMTKHFSMRFPILSKCRKDGRNYRVSGLYANAHRTNQPTPTRHYIHRDDVRMLMPQVNDIAIVSNDNGFDSVQRLHDAYDVLQITGGVWKLWEIIQRNGKPFFWPEREE